MQTKSIICFQNSRIYGNDFCQLKMKKRTNPMPHTLVILLVRCLLSVGFVFGACYVIYM